MHRRIKNLTKEQNQAASVLFDKEEKRMVSHEVVLFLADVKYRHKKIQR